MIKKIRLFLFNYRFIFFKRIIGNNLFETLPNILQTNNKVAVLWTGGKDCNLAFYESQLLGFEVVCLIGFFNKQKTITIESLELMERQAEALNIPFISIEVSKFSQSDYVNVILNIKSKYQISTVVTGIISNLNGNIYWLKKICKASDINLFCPLWNKNRKELLNKFIAYNFSIIFIAVKEQWFTDIWLGRSLSLETIAELEKTKKYNCLDLCGEKNEYDTIVLDGPIYKNKLDVVKFTQKKYQDLMYLEIDKCVLIKNNEHIY